MFRLFVAVNLPQENKNKLQIKIDKIKKRYQKMNIRFISPEQWHFTLVFLGYQEKNFLPIIEETLKGVISNRTKPLVVNFDKIIYSPSGARARMIWLKTTKETSIALDELKNNIERGFEKSGIIWKKENRPYQAHVTLARFSITFVGRLPVLEENFEDSFKIKTIDLMKSTLHREGAKYEKLSSFAF